MVKGLEAAAYLTTFMNKVIDLLQSTQPSPPLISERQGKRAIRSLEMSLNSSGMRGKQTLEVTSEYV
jgi:hypothetical protein